MVVADPAPDDSEPMRLQTEWQALPVLTAAWERALQARFDKAIAALNTTDRQHAALLQQNRSALEQAVLRLEIIMGIDSPPALSRERLQLQVDVLQSSLKAGQKPLSQQEQLLNIVGLPALVDQQLGIRIERLAARSDSSSRAEEKGAGFQSVSKKIEITGAAGKLKRSHRQDVQ